jgi:hypothetical protein
MTNKLPAPDPRELARSEDLQAYDEIAKAVRTVVEKGYGTYGDVVARRDVHPKHHGCVRAELRVEANLDDLGQGIFAQPGATYKAWVRFSNGNKRPRPDTLGDSRGMAIKLLAVPGPRLLDDQRATQDFVCSTHPAFFARNARDMVEVAKLEARDRFPSDFFAKPERFPGLAALMAIGSIKAVSPVTLDYYSQTPYRLGEHIVKWRLRPVHEPNDFKPSSAEVQDDNYLYRALAARLDPAGARPEVVYELQAQQRMPGEPVDDGTIIWRGDFVTLATLHIPTQRFDSLERMRFAEDISYNPWNGLQAHRPLGSLNRARYFAYDASSKLRHERNHADEPSYTSEEWDEAAQKDQAAGADPAWTPPALPQISPSLRVYQTLVSIFPDAFGKLARWLGSSWGYSLSVLALATCGGIAFTTPERFMQPVTLINLPSEALIPGERYSPKYADTAFAKDASVRRRDLTWAFRYLPTGSEFEGGTPYWVFRALPIMFQDQAEFTHGDWSYFGLRDNEDDHEFYESYHGLPRGVVLSDTTIHVAGSSLPFKFSRVSFNCATCHRGEYKDQNGNSQFADGMPNVGVDTAGYKRVMFRSLRDGRFNAERLIETINALLARDHQGAKAPPRLNAVEEIVYRGLVAALKSFAFKKPLEWMDDTAHRPENGPGRLDAFGALRFEFMRRSPQRDFSLATVDLPSIWHQSNQWRPRHHFDGNTHNVAARNVGAIVGVGGKSYSIDHDLVDTLEPWIANRLQPAPYPFGTPDAQAFAAGKLIYEHQCAACHGKYGAQGQLTERTSCMDKPLPTDCSHALRPEDCIATDPARAAAVDSQFAIELNDFGADHGLWPSDAFVSTNGYLCPPLDGIWARAPYLHNGSVPTIADLLSPVAERPETFRRGNPEYDTVKLGFQTGEASDGRRTFPYDTHLVGNRNSGHDSAGQLVSAHERAQLIEYLKTL